MRSKIQAKAAEDKKSYVLFHINAPIQTENIIAARMTAAPLPVRPPYKIIAIIEMLPAAQKGTESLCKIFKSPPPIIERCSPEMAKI